MAQTPTQSFSSASTPTDSSVVAPLSGSPTSQSLNSLPPADNIQSLQKSADAGNAKSQTELGHLYQAGKGVPTDPAQAFKLYTESANQGDAEGQWSLGSCYLFGVGVKSDPVQAVAWYRKAADQGNYVGSAQLSLCFSVGWGVPQDKEEANRWKQVEIKECRLAADQGDAAAQSHLASCYENADGVEKNMVEAEKWYRKAANQGDADSERALGKYYANGIVVKKDSVESAQWYRKAAEQGDAESQILLGVCYERGKGVDKDVTEAEKWYSRGTDIPARPMNLAFQYWKGDGVEKDSVEAAVLFRVAAERGDASAQAMLGDFYRAGVGVQKDAAEAVQWYRKAAQQGFADAQYDLGMSYANGIGVEKDPTEAAKWYLMASNQGDGMAQAFLSQYFLTGVGVIKNEVEGLAWLYVSSSGGNQVAASQLSAAERIYSVALIESARKRASELQAQIAASKAQGNSVTAVPPPPTSDAPKESGSGAIISADGMVLTAAHVVRGAARILIITADGSLPATVVKIDANNDVALLKCKGGNLIPLSIAPSKNAREGSTVFTIGFPNIQMQGFNPKLTKGEISSDNGYQDDPRQWQVSVPIQPGNSGGPLCDENGNIIGMVEATLDPLQMAKIAGEIPQNVNYAVKSSYILPLIDDVSNLPPPVTAPAGQKFEDTVGRVQKSAVLILVY